MVAAAADPSRPPLIPSSSSNSAHTTTTPPPPSSSPNNPSRRLKSISSRYLSSAAAASAPARRSLSTGRARPPSPTSPPPLAGHASGNTVSRSLCVSFQGESFFIQTRKPTPERRRSSVSSSSPTSDGAPPHRWPAASRVRSATEPLARSLDCALDKKSEILSTIHLLRQASFDDARTAAAGFETTSEQLSSDSDSMSSGESTAAAAAAARGISVPARFWQETNSRMRQLPVVSSPRMAGVKPRSPSPARKMASPVKGTTGAEQAIAPSIISFAAEVRRAKKGENLIEEAHQLRLLDNRHLQWRSVNAKVDATLSAQRLTAEKNLYNAWRSTSELRDSVTVKRIKLELHTQKLKLYSILKGQMAYLEEWSRVDKDHSRSLSGAIEALKASTLRLPVVDGAKADIQGVKDAVCSAVDVMHTMVSSIYSSLSKVDGTSSLLSELAKVASQEEKLLDQSRDLLSTVAAMHVRHSSLQGQVTQLKQACRVQL